MLALTASHLLAVQSMISFSDHIMHSGPHTSGRCILFLKILDPSVRGRDGRIAIQRASYDLGHIADEIIVGIVAALTDLIIIAVVISHDPGAADHIQYAPQSARPGARIPGGVLAAVAYGDAVVNQIVGDEGVVCAGSLNIYAVFVLINYIVHYEVVAGENLDS